MSNNLGVGKTLELLDRLKGTVRDLAARADKLNLEFQTQTARERRQREAAVAEQATRLSTSIEEADAAFATAKEAAAAK